MRADASVSPHQPVDFESAIQCYVMVRLSVELRRGSDNQAVPATLLSLTSKHIEDFTVQWRPPLEEASQEDKYWDWHFKQRLSETRDNHETYAVECDGDTQGLMALETQQHRSQFFPGRPLVYVAKLSAAPWNRRPVQSPPRFKTVGRTLLEYSRVRSLELGYAGSVGLHSLPEVEGFYEHLNMMRLEPDPGDVIDADELPLVYFEYPPSPPSGR